MGITIFKIFIWGGISWDIRSEITFSRLEGHHSTCNDTKIEPGHVINFQQCGILTSVDSDEQV